MARALSRRQLPQYIPAAPAVIDRIFIAVRRPIRTGPGIGQTGAD
jgi:hypothetical protein